MKFKKLFVLIVFTFVIVLSGCVSNRPPVSEPLDLGLNQVRDMQDLKALLSKDNKSGIFPFFRMFGSMNNDALMETGMEDTLGGDSTPSHSTTNVQVEGVDEGDIIKTDGNRIYSITYDRLQVVQLLGDGHMELLLNDRLEAVETNNYRYAYFSDLYITNKYLIVIGQSWVYTYFDSSGKIVPEVDPTINDEESDGDASIENSTYLYAPTSSTVIRIYDIDTLELSDEYEVSGYYLSSRLIENSLYVISNHHSYYYNTLENYDPRPWIRENGEMSVPDFTDIKYLPDMQYQSFTVITSFLLADEITETHNIFLGSSNWGQIYVSPTNIYFATTLYDYDFFGNWKQRGMLISYQVNSETGVVTYGGSGQFLGYVINQFAMDEYDGYMRIVTTEGWGDSVKNRLYIFERTVADNKLRLKRVSLIDEGIGKPRETVRSVRFNKEYATIVTYEQTDPFYTVDLSDPLNPSIKGELEVTGFSLYQHPWTDTLVLGIGQEAEGNNILGLKLALYDITDFENPVEVGSPLVLLNQLNSWTFSEALYNHKAILVAKEKGFIGFSIWRSRWFSSYYANTNDYIIFDINPESSTPITIKHTISHYHLFEENRQAYTTANYYGYWNFNIERAVYIGDYLYVVSGEAISSHNLVGEFSTIQEMVFVSEALPAAE